MCKFNINHNLKVGEIMNKELSYFNIDNCYGGNQEWFHNPTIRFRGCAALTSCDLCIYLSLFKDIKHLYPFNRNLLHKEDYIKFSETMKEHLYPRKDGIPTLELYIDRFKSYLDSVKDEYINISSFSAKRPIYEGEKIIINQINKGIPIPFLLLRHKNKDMYELIWHWFLIVGYKEIEEELFVKIATYGKYQWVLFRKIWESGHNKKGGIIIIDLKK